jgi:hypothetical protein
MASRAIRKVQHGYSTDLRDPGGGIPSRGLDPDERNLLGSATVSFEAQQRWRFAAVINARLASLRIPKKTG